MGEDGDDRDPFDRLDDAVGDREGDPFEELAADAEGAAGENDGTPPGDDPADAGVEEVSEPRTGPATAAPGDHPADADAFSEAKPDLAEVDVGDVDEDEVWAALSAARARGSVAEVRDRTYAEVSKHRYCEGCEHFTAPPRAACTNEGTEILAFVDMETVRVVDCPIVAERRRLERQG